MSNFRQLRELPPYTFQPKMPGTSHEFGKGPLDAGDDELDTERQGYEAEDLGEDVHAGVAQELYYICREAEREIDDERHTDDGAGELERQRVRVVNPLGEEYYRRHGSGPCGERDRDRDHRDRNHLREGVFATLHDHLLGRIHHVQAGVEEEESTGDPESIDADVEKAQDGHAGDHGDDHGNKRGSRGDGGELMLFLVAQPVA